MTRRATATSPFGVGRRENHDATDFYARFCPPALSGDDTVHGPLDLGAAGPLRCADSRHLDLPDNSVALVVTSPPYFAGKEYEEALGQGHIPATYLEYLQMLRDVFTECARVLEPGGRIAVNVANLGRKPYRSLAADVIGILQDDLGLLLRGEVVWAKADGASGSCAWGSFRSAANPVLRDITERVVIASKGRFDRARSRDRREADGLPHRDTLANDEFMEATLDLWRLPPESARRVGHPAPFPVELPRRLIELYTYVDDLVLDPFLGAGATAVAATGAGRHWVGYDVDASYVEVARARAAAVASDIGGGRQSRAVGEARSALDIAAGMLERAGFRIAERKHALSRLGLVVDLVAEDAAGARWYLDVTGGFTTGPSGLARTDTLWRSLGRVGVMAASQVAPVVLLTSRLPVPGSAGHRALRALGPGAVFDAMEMLDDAAQDRLGRYAEGSNHLQAIPGFWRPGDLAPRLAL